MIPLADLRTALKQPDSAEDGYIRQLEQAAVAFCERETGRYFGPAATRVEYFEVTGQRSVWLTDTPNGAVTATMDGAAVAAVDYELRGRELRHASAWGSHWYGADLRAEYTAGGVVTPGDSDEWTAPADIRRAVLELTALAFEQRIPVALGTVAPLVPLGVQRTLAHHRRYGA